MPLYEYECEQGHRFEKIQKFSDPPIDKCPQCGSPVRKLLSSPAIQFKGTGWYITDYAKKDSAAAGKSEKSEKTSESSSDTKTDSKPAGDTKSETKTSTETKSDSSTAKS